jgi:hypothetical protein
LTRHGPNGSGSAARRRGEQAQKYLIHGVGTVTFQARSRSLY